MTANEVRAVLELAKAFPDANCEEIATVINHCGAQISRESNHQREAMLARMLNDPEGGN